MREEKKRLVRSCVDNITMAPDTLEIEINYKMPEAISMLRERRLWPRYR